MWPRFSGLDFSLEIVILNSKKKKKSTVFWSFQLFLTTVPVSEKKEMLSGEFLHIVSQLKQTDVVETEKHLKLYISQMWSYSLFFFNGRRVPNFAVSSGLSWKRQKSRFLQCRLATSFISIMYYYRRSLQSVKGSSGISVQTTLSRIKIRLKL